MRDASRENLQKNNNNNREEIMQSTSSKQFQFKAKLKKIEKKFSTPKKKRKFSSLFDDPISPLKDYITSQKKKSSEKLLKKFANSRKKKREKTIQRNLSNISKIADLQELKELEKDYYLLNSNDKRFKICEAILEKNTTPSFLCFKKNSKIKRTVFDKAGPGLGIYFNFIKSTLIFFVIILIFSIPLQRTNIGFYKISKNLDLHQSQEGLSSKIFGFLISTTFGVLIKFCFNSTLGSFFFEPTSHRNKFPK